MEKQLPTQTKRQIIKEYLKTLASVRRVTQRIQRPYEVQRRLAGAYENGVMKRDHFQKMFRLASGNTDDKILVLQILEPLEDKFAKKHGLFQLLIPMRDDE